MLKDAALLIIALASAAAPAAAQIDPGLQRMAANIASARLTSKAWPVGYQVANVDPAKSPWTAMSSKQMADTQPASNRKKAYAVSANLDYNGDGALDQAYLANNATQSAVIVRLGGNKGQIVAFKADGRWGGGEEILSAGRRIMINFPESSAVILAYEGGKPTVHYVGD